MLMRASVTVGAMLSTVALEVSAVVVALDVSAVVVVLPALFVAFFYTLTVVASISPLSLHDALPILLLLLLAATAEPPPNALKFTVTAEIVSVLLSPPPVLSQVAVTV